MNEHEISRDLMPNEAVVWSGRPGQGMRLRKSDAWLIPFSLLWSGPVLSSYSRGNGSALFAAFAVYLLVGRFLVDSIRRSSTRYYLTRQRALILQTWPWRSVRSVELYTVEEITSTRHNDGTMTIAFGPATKSGRHRVEPPKFEWIREGRRAYRLALGRPPRRKERDASSPAA